MNSHCFNTTQRESLILGTLFLSHEPMQTLVQRAISSGLYFPLEEIFATTFYKSKLWDKNVNDSDDSMQQSKNRSGIAFPFQ